MNNMPLTSDTQPVSFDTPNGPIIIESFEGVWPASKSSGLTFLKVLEEDSVFDPEVVGNLRVLDLGSGTGVIGEGMSAYGVRHVTMTDNNPLAIENIKHNMVLNGIGNQRARALLADCFRGVPKGSMFNVIVGNCPMNPTSFGASHPTNAAFASNENGTYGRDVLDDVIVQSKRYLTPNGIIYLSASSRQDFLATEKLYDDYYGKKNWRIVFKQNQELDLSPGGYHAPYEEKWKQESMNDWNFRIFQLDENGMPILELVGSSNTKTLFYKDGKLWMKVQNGKPEPKFYFLDEAGSAILYTGIEDFEVPYWDRESPHFHTYYIIKAVNANMEP